MLQDLFRSRKTTGLILGGLAAFAYYKYSKMSAEEKSKLAQTFRETGRSLLDKIIPAGLKNDTASTS